MLAEGLEIKKIPSTKGNTRDVRFPQFNEYLTDVALDLGSPKLPTFDGIVVDHHPDHPIQRNYKLFWDKVPTGLIIWNEMKDYIPKSQWWRVAGSLTGDSAIEYLPPEIWDSFPQLLDTKSSIYRDTKTYKIKMGRPYPIYVYLSSGVNALCRMGNPAEALKKCLTWRSPIDAVTDLDVIEAKHLLDIEENTIMKRKPIAEIVRNRFSIIKISSSRPEFSMSGYMASHLMGQNEFLTIVVINETNGEVSIRGKLAKYLADKLRTKGYKSGGHAIAAGATVPLDQIEKFINDIRNI
jgi:hypothetical protein